MIDITGRCDASMVRERLISNRQESKVKKCINNTMIDEGTGNEIAIIYFVKAQNISS